MAGSEFFTVGLQDKVTGPSQKMGRAALKLERQLSQLERARQVKLKAGLGFQKILLDQDKLQKRRSSFMNQGPLKGPSLGDIGSGLRSATVGMMALGAAATAVVVTIGTKLVGAIKTATDTALSSKLAFTALLGSAQKSEDFQNRALVLSNRYGMDLTDTFGALKNSLSAGFDKKQSEGILGVAADLRFLGATGEGVGRAMLALNQIKTAGVLQGDEIRQLSEIGGLDVEAVYKQIGKRLGLKDKAGKSVVQQVMKLKEAGKVDSLTALNAIAETITSKTGMALGKAGEAAASGTLEGLQGKLEAKFQTLLFEVGREAGPSLVKGINALIGADTGETEVKLFLGLAGAVEKIGGFLERVGPMVPAIAENFVKAFGAASGLGDINLDSFADRLPEMATKFGEIAGSLVQITKSVAELLGNKDFINTVGTTISLASGGGAERFENSEYGKGAAKRGFWDSVRYGLGMDPKVSGKRFTEGVAGGAASSGAAEEAATGIAKGMTGAVDKELKIHSPSKVGFEKGKMFDQGMADGQLAYDLSGMAAQDNANGVASATQRALRRQPMSFGAETEAAADNMTRGRSSGSGVSVGDIHITIDGKGSTARETAQETLTVLEDQFGSMLDRLCQEVGA